MRSTTLLREILGLKYARVVGGAFEAWGLVVNVKPTTRVPFCSGCLRRVRRIYDRRPARNWRHLDLAGMEVRLQYDIRRVDCRGCGVRTELVPWAEPESDFTHEFEQMAAYLAQRTDKTTVSSLMRVAWTTVGSIVTRVVERLGPADRLDDLTVIGVDELSYRRHHEYVTVVIDHLKGDVVWVKEGKSADTLRQFFADLGPERAARLEAVTIDMSAAYIQAVTEATPQALLVFDRFHVQRLAHDALDAVRREQMRDTLDADLRKAVKGVRFVLQKNPWNLRQAEKTTLANVQRQNRSLYRAYLLKETLVDILDRRQANVAERLLDEWLRWAVRSRLRPFKKLARTIRRYKEGILAYVRTGLSNGRAEGLNGKIRTITRRSFGFHSAQSLIGMIFLCCAGLVLHPVRRVPSGNTHPLLV